MQLFDVTQPVKLRFRNAGLVTLSRYPSDHEWQERSVRHRPSNKNREPDTSNYDAALLDSLVDRAASPGYRGIAEREPGEGLVEKVEAMYAINVLNHCSVKEGGIEDIDASTIRVTAETWGWRNKAANERYTVTVTFKRPSYQVCDAFRRDLSKQVTVRGETFDAVSYKTGADLFDRMFISQEGYANDRIPINHKAALAEYVHAHIISETADLLHGGDDDPEA